MLRFISCASIRASLAMLIAWVGQEPAASPTPLAFEVATIKPTNPEFRGILVGGFRVGRFSAQGFTLKDLIGYACDVDNRQIFGGPKRCESDRYDVVGKPEKTGPLSQDNAKLMLQTLLTERFKLKIHREKKEMPVYVLTVAKGGLKMKPRTEGDGGAPGGMGIKGPKIPGRNTTVQFLAAGLQKLVLDRPFLDETGLTGAYDFDLSWRPDPSQFGGQGDKIPGNPDDPDLFAAMQEQLGLKLTAQKGQAPVIVVDKAEKPLEN